MDDDQPEDLSAKRHPISAPSGSQQQPKTTTTATKSALRTQLEARPTGLSLLVAALDASDPNSYAASRISAKVPLEMMESSSHIDVGGSRRRPSEPIAAVNGVDNHTTEKRRRSETSATTTKKSSSSSRRASAHQDVMMESQLLELSKENNRLKQELAAFLQRTTSAPTGGGAIQPERVVTPTVGDTPAQPWMNNNPAVLAQPVPIKPDAVSMSAPGLTLPTQGSNNPLLQQLYDAQYRVALAAQHGRMGLLSASVRKPPSTTNTGGAFQPVIGAPPVTAASPDSTVQQANGYNNYLPQTQPPQPNMLSSMPLTDSKTLLRSKLIERQQQVPVPPAPTDSPNATKVIVSSPLLESLLTRQTNPPPLNEKCFNSISTVTMPVAGGAIGTQNVGKQEPTALKQCLSSLAVQLDSSSQSTSEATGSHTSGSLSIGSPTSSQHSSSEHSTASVGQPSPLSGGSSGGTTTTATTISGDVHHTQRYKERRKRNNEAAKKCRANRRALFEYRYKRAQELEQDNTQLKDEIQRLIGELNELKHMLALKQQGDNNAVKLETQHDSGAEVSSTEQTPSPRDEMHVDEQ